MNKKVYAIAPFHYPSSSNFKEFPYKAWLREGGKEVKAHYLPSYARWIAYRMDFPTFMLDKKRCYLRFVEPCTISFDVFPEYIWSETIPVIWDCWPCYFDKVVKWLSSHRVKCAIFTSSQTAKKMSVALPELKVLHITEGIDVAPYQAGGKLVEREIDLLEYGSMKRNFFRNYVSGINHINRGNSNGCMSSWNKLVETMANAKVTVALPRCDTDPEFTGGIETLTQRFWEGMLSRTVMIGRAPKELVDLIGYNPVIDLDRTNPDQQVRDIVSHISDYQELVDKNRETALKMAPWELRMKKVMEWLGSLGYEI